MGMTETERTTGQIWGKDCAKGGKTDGEGVLEDWLRSLGRLVVVEEEKGCGLGRENQGVARAPW